MSCADVRTHLPDHLLATLPEIDDARVRRHLRGCAACRGELASLESGLALFSQATHASTPPPELEARVLSALDEEWRETPIGAPEPPRPPADRRRSRAAWTVATAAVLVLVVSVSWGVGQMRRADRSMVDAESYSRLLATLGGREFRVGELRGASSHDVEGSVILYDSVWGPSWAAVMLRSPNASGEVTATLTGPGGNTLPFDPIALLGGEGNGWLVTRGDVRAFDRLTVRSASGEIIATAEIESA